MKAVVLAAGKSTRMKSAKTKMAHTILGKEIINLLLDSLITCGIAPHDIVLVVSDSNAPELQRIVRHPVCYARQEPQLGTGHALLAAAEYIRDYRGPLLVTVGDNPYVTAPELQKLIDHHRRTQADCTFISAVFPGTPPPYGRILRDEREVVQGVVEEIDATPDQLQIREVNSSIYMFNNETAFPLLQRITNENAKGEYYLTDIIGLLKNAGRRVEAAVTDDYYISIGINHRWELQEAQERFNRENLKALALEAGVTILQPESVTVEFDVTIGRDTVIYPNTYIAAGTRIGENCTIGPFAYLRGVTVADGSVIIQEKRTPPAE